MGRIVTGPRYDTTMAGAGLVSTRWSRGPVPAS
jgi:hypothetical protein